MLCRVYAKRSESERERAYPNISVKTKLYMKMHKSVWKAANLTDGSGCLWRGKGAWKKIVRNGAFLRKVNLLDIFFCVSVFP